MNVTTLYVLKDMNGAVLYVGVSHRPWDRMDQHRGKPWWVDVASAEFTHYPTRMDAEIAERTLITALRPPGNTVWMPTSPAAPPSMLVHYDSWDRVNLPKPAASTEPTAEELGIVTIDDDEPLILP